MEWIGGVSFAVAVALGFATPILDLAGVIEPIEVLDGRAGHVAGAVLAVAGLALTLLAQFAMGTAWRVGVDPSETTELVTDGPFALVRNPIFSAKIPTALGLALLVPNAAAAVATVALVAALELQTRKVEEPYLLSAHGPEYRDYAARVGRFLPRVGRMRNVR